MSGPLTDSAHRPRSQAPHTENSQRNHGTITLKIPEVAGRCNSQPYRAYTLLNMEYELTEAASSSSNVNVAIAART